MFVQDPVFSHKMVSIPKKITESAQSKKNLQREVYIEKKNTGSYTNMHTYILYLFGFCMILDFHKEGHACIHKMNVHTDWYTIAIVHFVNVCMPPVYIFIL